MQSGRSRSEVGTKGGSIGQRRWAASREEPEVGAGGRSLRRRRRPARSGAASRGQAASGRSRGLGDLGEWRGGEWIEVVGGVRLRRGTGKATVGGEEATGDGWRGGGGGGFCEGERDERRKHEEVGWDDRPLARGKLRCSVVKIRNT